MSSLIFPDLPGLDIAVEREPYYRETVHETVSGREYRTTWDTYPRYRYRLRFNLLRAADAGQRELETLVGFYQRHAGRHDSFLYRDAEDCQVTDMEVGVGNGSATQFQLQRALAGTFTDLLGTWPTYTWTRVNRILQSATLTASPWSPSQVVVTPNAWFAPDGSITGVKVADNAVNAGHALAQSMSSAPAGTYTASVYISSGSSGTASIDVYGAAVARVVVDLSTGTLTPSGANYVASSAPLTSDGRWRRVTLTYAQPASGVVTMEAWPTANSGSYVGTGSYVFVWRPQVEAGSEATRPIVTGAALALESPAYWPAYSGGFEPITEPNWTTVTLKRDGVPFNFFDGWTPGTGGVVNCSPALPAGVVLSWTGAYLRRCRFAEDSLPTTRIVNGMHEAELQLVSVK